MQIKSHRLVILIFAGLSCLIPDSLYASDIKDDSYSIESNSVPMSSSLIQESRDSCNGSTCVTQPQSDLEAVQEETLKGSGLDVDLIEEFDLNKVLGTQAFDEHFKQALREQRFRKENFSGHTLTIVTGLQDGKRQDLADEDFDHKIRQARELELQKRRTSILLARLGEGTKIKAPADQGEARPDWDEADEEEEVRFLTQAEEGAASSGDEGITGGNIGILPVSQNRQLSSGNFSYKASALFIGAITIAGVLFIMGKKTG